MIHNLFKLSLVFELNNKQPGTWDAKLSEVKGILDPKIGIIISQLLLNIIDR